MKGHILRAYGPVTYAIALPLCIYILLSIKQELFFVQSVACDISGASTLLATELFDYIDSLKLCSATYILKKTLQNYPVLENLTITRTVNQLLFCDASIKKPIYSINNNTVITEDGNLYSAALFEPTTLVQAKKCIIQDATLLQNSQKLYALLNKIDDTLLQEYTLEINSMFDTWLYPIQTNSYAIRFTLDQPLNKKVIEAGIGQLQNLITDKKAFGSSKGCIVMDVRFTNQLIFYREQRGEL